MLHLQNPVFTSDVQARSARRRNNFSRCLRIFTASVTKTSFRYFQQYFQKIVRPGEERCMVRVQIVD